MKELKILVVEDSKETSDLIKRMLSKVFNEGHIEQALTLESAEEQLRNGSYDLALLDIQLPRGTSFDLLQKMNQTGTIDFEIIFVTGHSEGEYLMKAIKYSAIDYINKPIDENLLLEAIEKAEKKISARASKDQVKLLLEHLGANSNSNKRIALHLSNGVIEFIEVENVVYCKSDGVVTEIHTKSGEQLVAMRHLGFYKPLLMQDHGFYPISNQILVNLNYIKRYRHSELSLSLTTGETLYASRRGGKEFKDFLQRR